MKKDLRDYVKVYKNHIPEKLCDNTVKELQNVDFELHKFYIPIENKSYSDVKELSSYYKEISTSKQIVESTWNVLHEYIVKDIAFPWNTIWTGFSPPKFNKYETNTQMKEHCDHIYSLFTGERRGIPILTILGSLNDGYSGGELVLFTDEVYTLNKGDVIVFPSNFLYPHRINEITAGVRYSYAAWSY